MLRQEREVAVEIKRRGRIRQPNIGQVVPSMGSRQVDCFAGAIGEVARISWAYAQWSLRGRLRYCAWTHEGDQRDRKHWTLKIVHSCSQVFQSRLRGTFGRSFALRNQVLTISVGVLSHAG